ncbi:MAG: DNA polymerase III subunit delta [Candidatus Aminicenantes bacterium]|nr:DNA polymerase III subunit delta [Candidatus Aminicenantes bacterium]
MAGARLRPCYLFYGEDPFEAREFIEATRARLFAGKTAEFGVERYDLAETGWREIVDSARTTASLFADWRLIVVRVEAKRAKPEDEAAAGAATPGPARRGAVKGGQEILAEYLAAPSERTVLVIVLAGPAKKSHPLVKLLTPFADTAVEMEELRPLKDYQAGKWLQDRAARRGVRLEPAAIERLFEIAGYDKAVLAGELEKLSLYAGERRAVTADDIDRLAGWVKSFESYEIENGLLAADVRQTLVIIDRLFRDGHRPEEVVSKMTNVFRDLLMAKLRLREGAGRKEVFAELKPQINPAYIKVYRPVFDRLFALVDRLSFDDLRSLLGGLRRVDEKLKTSDSAPQALIERFVVEFGATAEKRGIISPRRRSGARLAG